VFSSLTKGHHLKFRPLTSYKRQVVSGEQPPGQIPPGQLPPRTIATKDNCHPGANPGGRLERLPPQKPTKVTAFAIQDNFVVYCFITAVLRCILHPSYSSETTLRLHYQIFQKSPSSLTLLAGSPPAATYVMRFAYHIKRAIKLNLRYRVAPRRVVAAGSW